ncbi:M56 family metallopeptidase [Roseateles sp. L2-2]|uniref:M56 family metallopeptidase n=1 Tax=Roseateles sp. L2-2 TaxID=3422597 RepID=UPI003D3685BF
MTDVLLQTLLRQTALLSVIALALLALRRPLARHVGPGFAYVGWALLPMLLVVDLLPASPPATQFSAALIHQFGPALDAATTAPLKSWMPASGVAMWLAIWVTGALAILARMIWLQWRFRAQGPALVGLWPARLVLPSDFEERFDAVQRSLVLTHEDVHRRRFDNHWNALAAGLCALHWFNPLAWLALRAMRADQELSCDHAVMRRFPARAADYARALLRAQPSLSPLQPWSGWRSSHSSSHPSTHLSSHPLIERVAMLAVRPHSRSRRLFGASGLVVLALGAAGAVQAMNAVMPDLAIDPVALELTIQLNRRSNGVVQEQKLSTMRLVTESGKKSLVVIGGKPDLVTPDQVRIEIAARRRDGKRVYLDFDVKEAGQPVLKSTLLVEDGIDSGVHSSPEDPNKTEIVIRVRTLPLGDVPGYRSKQ